MRNVRGPGSRTRTWTAAAAAAAALTATLATGTAQADPGGLPSAPGSTVAAFEGGTLDMAGDWGAAKACLVWRAAGTVECFRTLGELRSVEAKLADRAAGTGARSASGALAACSSPLELFEHGWFGGRRLVFYDRGYWQNLGGWGFNDQMSSYKVGACYAHLAEHNDGVGYWYPGNTAPWAQEGALRSGWNDRVSSIKLD
ncbi:hypothetical protein [Streptomyces sp. NPDC101132]|uniref:hypothetical protein n=1 Tax=Streptomyces sp. NPDC101132 TaxID=3366110 RepID=UPI0037F5476D